ncbi:MAG: ABC transporter ATP-binding protein [Planctomycetaceae bacterium]
MTDPCLTVQSLTHRYGDRTALSDVSFSVPGGCLFGLLGPNGSGKTTLFRLLATLLPLQQGKVQVCGFDLETQPADVRRRLGVTFQSPAVDGRLTVIENLDCHGRIYGLPSAVIRQRSEELLNRLELSDRRHSMVGELSGGLRRRVELAKGLMHSPQLLLLDEPSVGLDPAARRYFWDLISEFRGSTTVIVTTHLMEEAEQCEQLLLLNAGQTVTSGSPQQLQSSVNGQRLTVRTRDNRQFREPLETLIGQSGRVVGNRLCFRVHDGAASLQKIMQQMGGDVQSAEIAQPTLEDVFLELTGRDFSEDGPEAEK